jgi:hypothetical protein
MARGRSGWYGRGGGYGGEMTQAFNALMKNKTIKKNGQILPPILANTATTALPITALNSL